MLMDQLMLTAIAGSGMLSFSIAINAVSEHGACTVIFVAVGAVIAFLVASIQTLDKISWIGWIGVGSIISAVITLAVAVGVSDRPSAAPQTGPFEIDVKASANPGFIDAMNAINIILFAFSGTPCFFNIVGEMRNVKDYTKSVLVCQTGVTTIYLVCLER
jgi:amino acid permease